MSGPHRHRTIDRNNMVDSHRRRIDARLDREVREKLRIFREAMSAGGRRKPSEIDALCRVLEVMLRGERR